MDARAIILSILHDALQTEARAGGRAVLLAGVDENLRAEARARLEPGTEVLFAAEMSGADNNATRWLLPPLALPDMADLCAGRASGPFAAQALDLLLAGRTVQTLAFSHKTREASAPPALYALCREYENRLASFGLTELRPHGERAPDKGESLVTERTVREARRRGEGTVTVRPGGVVTPLAAEAARDLGIRIIKQGGNK